MRRVLFQYDLDPTTWVYLSSLMTIGIYFKFRRFWSVRNADLIGLIAFAPGLLLVAYQQQRLGYAWLAAVGMAYLVRLVIDPVMVRRPLLEPNLSVDGLVFTGVALLVFLLSNVITTHLTQSDRQGAVRMDRLLAGQLAPDEAAELAPGYPPFQVFSTYSNTAFVPSQGEDPAPLPHRALVRAVATRTTVILGHLAIVVGIVLVGYRHFDNLHTGMAAAVLYLLLPYTSQMTSRVDHVVPAALLVWTIEAYRRPMVAGVLLGLAAGLIAYPLFLVPLFLGFYWRRGAVRFLLGAIAALAVLVGSLFLISPDAAAFSSHVLTMFGARAVLKDPLVGFWSFHEPVYRIPVVVAFAIGSLSLLLWPAQKNLGTLLSCSAAVMLGVSFWYDPGAGVYHMAWFLPLLLLTVFRPNLEDRVALTTVVP
ncbi:MAG: hypothetical protein JW809_08415 [Pirellulales bacterium]|nr:hypothetical protein [Pirellulales bacterium]